MFGIYTRFTDLAVGAALPSFALRFAPASAAVATAPWSASLLPTVTPKHKSLGCYAPVSCGGRGECRSAAAIATGEPICECYRDRFGDNCNDAVTPAIVASAAVTNPSVATTVSFAGGGGLQLPAGALPLAANITADLYDPTMLPTALLPSLNNSFSPASLVVDLRPSGTLFVVPVTLQLVRLHARSCVFLSFFSIS